MKESGPHLCLGQFLLGAPVVVSQLGLFPLKLLVHLRADLLQLGEKLAPVLLALNLQFGYAVLQLRGREKARSVTLAVIKTNDNRNRRTDDNSNGHTALTNVSMKVLPFP